MTFAVHPKNEAQIKAVKAALEALKVPYDEEPETQRPYDVAFMAEIDKGRKDAMEGRGTVIKTEDLWK
jgi:hypothetical protein